MMTNLIIKITKYLSIRFINYKYSSSFSILKENTILKGSNLTLETLFNDLYAQYNKILINEGL